MKHEIENCLAALNIVFPPLMGLRLAFTVYAVD